MASTRTEKRLAELEKSDGELLHKLRLTSWAHMTRADTYRAGALQRKTGTWREHTRLRDGEHQAGPELARIRTLAGRAFRASVDNDPETADAARRDVKVVLQELLLRKPPNVSEVMAWLIDVNESLSHVGGGHSPERWGLAKTFTDLEVQADLVWLSQLPVELARASDDGARKYKLAARAENCRPEALDVAIKRGFVNSLASRMADPVAAWRRDCDNRTAYLVRKNPNKGFRKKENRPRRGTKAEKMVQYLEAALTREQMHALYPWRADQIERLRARFDRERAAEAAAAAATATTATATRTE
jgi:hypothetical protein